MFNRNTDTTALLIQTMNRLEEGQNQLKDTVNALHRELVSMESKIGDIQRMGARLEGLETRMILVEQAEVGDLLKMRDRIQALEKLAMQLESDVDINSQAWENFHLQQTQAQSGRQHLMTTFKESIVGVFGNLAGMALVITLTLLIQGVAPTIFHSIIPQPINQEAK